MNDRRASWWGWKRRAFGRAAMRGLACLAALVLVWTPTAFAQPSAESDTLLPDPGEMARVEASIDRALEYLVKTQNPDGSWPSAGNYNAVNAICLLAFLGRGHEAGRGPFAPVVDRAVAAILSKQNPETGLLGAGHHAMYDHGLCTLALTEAYGFIPSAEMRRRVQKAVDLIVKAQSPAGGWRYNPTTTDQDLSVTVMQVVALRSALNARLDVPQETIDKATKYVRACAVPAGGFAYNPGGGPTPAQSAAGSLCMQLLGAFEQPDDAQRINKALDYLTTVKAWQPGTAYFFYTNYYAMQSHFQVGGDYWNRWHPRVRQQLLDSQAADGSFPAQQEAQFNGPAQCYSTGFGALVLNVYLHYLPAYQR